jgi:TolA-binding protein
MAGFKEVLNEAPSHKLADNAQYWFAECYYATGQFEQAITEFKKVFAYPETEKDDDAQLKIAYAYFQMGDKPQALMELNKFLTEFPDSELTGQARRKILQIEGM